MDGHFQTDRQTDLTILVNSCDLYEDAWEPFFRLLKIQWPDCESYSIILNTENKMYNCDFLPVKTFCGGTESTWSKRLLNCLETIDSEYVLFFLEDEFLLKAVNVNELNKVICFLNKNKDVGVLYPHKTNKQKEDFQEDYFPRDYITETKRLVCICAIWRKSFLKKVLREEESPWDFEMNAPARSKEYPERVLQYNKSLPDLITYDDQIEIGYGITERKWLPKTKELFDQYGIAVNYDNLGFYPYENQKIAAEESAKMRKKERPAQLNPLEIAHNIKKKVMRYMQKRKTNFSVR